MGFIKSYVRGICLELLRDRREYDYFIFNDDYKTHKKGDIISGVVMILKDGIMIRTYKDGNSEFIEKKYLEYHFKSSDSLKEIMEG